MGRDRVTREVALIREPMPKRFLTPPTYQPSRRTETSEASDARGTRAEGSSRREGWERAPVAPQGRRGDRGERRPATTGEMQ